MSAVNRSGLHIANSIEELNKMAAELPKVLNVRAYLNTAEQVYKKGNDMLSMGDEETSYVMFVRYFNIVTCVQRMSEFKKKQEQYQPMINQAHYNRAVQEAQRLKQSLQSRYDQRHSQQLERHRKELELERAKMETNQARLQNQRTAVRQQSSEVVGWEKTLDPSTGQYEYNVVAKDM